MPGFNSGAAYVFKRGDADPGKWMEVARVIGLNPTLGDRFGKSVSISGDTIIVGAYADRDFGKFAGSVSVFDRDAGGAENWGMVRTLSAPEPVGGDQFGYSVSISGDTVLVGAPIESYDLDFSGSTYVFNRNHNGIDEWGLVTRLTNPDAKSDSGFGQSVSMDGDLAIIGNPFGFFLEQGGVGVAYVFGP